MVLGVRESVCNSAKKRKSHVYLNLERKNLKYVKTKVISTAYRQLNQYVCNYYQGVVVILFKTNIGKRLPSLVR